MMTRAHLARVLLGASLLPVLVDKQRFRVLFDEHASYLNFVFV